MKSPECKGSQHVPHIFIDNKRSLCPFCQHIVAVENGKLATHWWSDRSIMHYRRKRYAPRDDHQL